MKFKPFVLASVAVLLVAGVVFLFGCGTNPTGGGGGQTKMVFQQATGLFATQIDSEANRVALFSSNFDGTGAVDLTAAGYNTDTAKISPDGSKVAYRYAVTTEVVNVADMSTGTVLTAVSARCFAWAPNSRFLAYSDGDLKVLDLSSSTTTEVVSATITPEVACDYVSFSHNGSMIAYEKGDDIYVITISTTSEQQITSDSAKYYNVAFSPSNDMLAAVRGSAVGPLNIYDLASPSTPTLIENGGFVIKSPVWSPDGNFIYYSSMESDGDRGIFRADTSGNNKKQITGGTLEANNEVAPAFFSGTSKLFYTLMDHGLDLNGAEIWSINTDGTGATKITSNEVMDCTDYSQLISD